MLRSEIHMTNNNLPVFLTRPVRIVLSAILVVYLVLATVYTLVTPPLESPDAYYHFGVIEYFSREFKLPTRENPQDHPWTHAVFHAPLYYMASGLLIAPIDTSDFPELYPKNPHARIGLPHSLNNHNFVSIKGEAWQQTYLAVYVVRAFSIMWGAISLIAIFMLGRILVPDKLWMAGTGTAFVALTPQFLYMSAVINNDNMVVACGLVTLMLLIYMIKFRYSWQLIGMMSIVMAMGALAKVNALPLYPTVALGLTWIAYRDRLGWKKLITWGLVIFAVWAVMDGWWYVYNMVQSGDFTATVPLAEAAGGASGVPTGLDNLWGEFVGVYYSFWGLFGWFNIIAPQSFYNYITALLLIAGLGVIYGAIRRPATRNDRVIVGLLVIHALLVFAGWWRFRGMVSAAQGRMLFSVLAALASGVAYGLTVYTPRWTRILPGVMLGGVAVAAVSFPITLLAPAYQKPTQLDTIPEHVNLVDVRYGPVVLRGYTINEKPINYWQYQVPADREFVEITLYWQPLERTDIPLSMFVQVYAPNENFEPVEVGKVDSYPGRGMMRTDAWETGIIYADKYYLELYGDFDLTPFEPRFRVGLRDNAADTDIPATTIDGDPIDAVVPRGGSVYSTEVSCSPPEHPTDVLFAPLAHLNGYSLETINAAAGSAFDLHLQWSVLEQTTVDYTIFVQLIDPEQPGELLGSGDSMPRQTWYPTSSWMKDVCFDDRYTVHVQPDAPPGVYRLLVGIYNRETGMRLNATHDDPTVVIGGGYLLDTPVTITAQGQS